MLPREFSFPQLPHHPKIWEADERNRVEFADRDEKITSRGYPRQILLEYFDRIHME